MVMAMYKEKLSDCELDLMQILWDLGPEMSQPQIKAELERRKNREYGRTTIATWLGRMRKSGYVDLCVKEKTSYFFPLITRKEYEEQELNYFARRLFQGSYAKAMMAFAKSEQLTEADEKVIQEMIDGWND